MACRPAAASLRTGLGGRQEADAESRDRREKTAFFNALFLMILLSMALLIPSHASGIGLMMWRARR